MEELKIAKNRRVVPSANSIRSQGIQPLVMMMVRRVIVGMAAIMRVGDALIRTVRIDNRMARFDGPLHLIFDPSHDRVQSNCIAQIREHKW